MTNDMDNQPGTLREMALFAGAGGGILGGHLLGWKTVCAVEWEPYPACVLAARQNDKILPPFPIWDDVQTFDGKPWRGLVDVVSGGFPCQDISAAGKGAGITGSKSSMWKHMARIIDEVRPRFAFVENSPMLIPRGAAMVIGDLAEMGYDCEWCIVSASDCGAPHTRDRFWLKATATDMADSNSTHGERNKCAQRSEQERADTSQSSWWASEPDVGRVADGVSARVDRLKAIGNGQVPIVATTAFRILRGR
jgi:DNA (cytosine-5)-methyltransferase 1